VHNKLAAKGSEIRYNADQYADPIIHPVDGRIVMEIDRTRIPAWWIEIEAELTPAELANIITLTPDWFPPVPPNI